MQDADIIENASSRRAEFETLTNEIVNVEEALNYLAQSLQFKHISSIDADQSKNIEKMIHQVEALQRQVNSKFSDPHSEIAEELQQIENEVNENYDLLKTKDAKTLIPLIQRVS